MNPQTPDWTVYQAMRSKVLANDADLRAQLAQVEEVRDQLSMALHVRDTQLIAWRKIGELANYLTTHQPEAITGGGAVEVAI